MKHQNSFRFFAKLAVAMLLTIYGTRLMWAGSLFTGPINSPAGSSPWALVAGDFNGDGLADIALTDLNSDKAHGDVDILLGDGDGTFQPPAAYRVGSLPDSVAVGDFNGDGILDLAVVSIIEPGRISGTVSVLQGNGDGTFGVRTKYHLGRAPVSVAVGDFNGDGKLDLVVTNEAVRGKQGSIGILLGNGDGTFQPAIRTLASRSPALIAVGDLNGDGRLDLVVADRCAVECGKFATTALLGNGDGTFRVAWSFANTAIPSGIALGDLNGDGKLDLVETADRDNVAIRLGNGDGTFQKATHSAAGTRAGSIALADFNDDGQLDVAVTNGGFPGGVSVLRGKGNGFFKPPLSFPLNPAVMAIQMVAADVNGDGRPDLVVTDYFNSVVSVLLNTGKK